MESSRQDSNPGRDLRSRAEEFIRMSGEKARRMSPENLQALVHELQVHQIELEMQNEELRRAHLELEESRERFRSLYDFAPVGYFTLNAGGSIENANLTVALMLGVTREELIRKKFTTFIAREDQDAFYLWRRNLRKTRTKQCCELKCSKGDGDLFWARLEGVPTPNEMGEISGIRITLSDITDRREAEDAMKAAVNQNKSILAAALDPIITIDSFGVVRQASDSLLKVFGWTPKEVIGKGMGILMPEPHRSHYAKYLARFRRRGETNFLGRVWEFEAMRKDGTRFPVELSVTRVEIPGSDRPLFTGIIRDISDRKKAEQAMQEANRMLETTVESRTMELKEEAETRAQAERAATESERRYREMLERMTLISVILDPEGSIVFCNNFLTELTGWRPDEVLGRNWFELFIPPELQDELRELHARNIAGDFSPHFQNEILTRDGRRRIVSWNNASLRNPEGEIVGTASIGEDITERQRAEEQLIQNRKLEGLGQLAAGVAHDFNNTLGIISGALELLDDQVGTDPTHPDVAAFLKMIQNATNSGIAIVRRLQNFARHRLAPPVDRVDVNRVVNEVVEMTRPRWKYEMETKGYSVILEIDESSRNSFVQGDEGEIQEILVNLMNNAIDAMPKGGRIRIATEDMDGGVQVIVSDSGVGMTPEVRERAFDPFFTTKGTQGSGLGLSSVFGIVKRYGGSLEIESEPGAGTSIVVKFPSPEEEEKMAESLTISPAKPARLLLVEDEPDMARVIKALLETEGYVVEVSSNGAAGIATFSESPFDLVITDLAMPGMSGIEFARKVKAITEKTPVILLTGWQTVMEPEEMAEACIDRVMVKPVRRSELHLNVAELLSK